VAPDLHQQLAQATLVVFKGDLNYRKLAYDCRWPFTAKFSDALGPFRPAPLVTLRTLKADVIAGVGAGGRGRGSQLPAGRVCACMFGARGRGGNAT
jgi:hypothetical protein